MFAVVPMSCVTGKRLRQLEVPCLAQEVACEPRRRARGGIERLRRHIASGAPVNDTDRVSAYRRLHGRSRQNKEETMNARALRMLFGAVALSAIAAVLAGGANARPAEGAGVPAEIYSASTSPVVNEHQTPQSGTFLVDPEIYSAFTSPTVLSEQRDAREARGRLEPGRSRHSCRSRSSCSRRASARGSGRLEPGQSRHSCRSRSSCSRRASARGSGRLEPGQSRQSRSRHRSRPTRRSSPMLTRRRSRDIGVSRSRRAA